MYTTSTVTSSTQHWLSIRVRLICMSVFVVGSLLPPYVPKAALAPPETQGMSRQFLLVEEGFIMKSSSLTQQGARRAYAEGIVHTIKEGESLDRLANRYQISVDTIRWANDIIPGSTIRPGDEILILPVDGVLHTVSRGQTLSRIAQLYDISQEEIVEQNKLKGAYILAGQELIIPDAHPIVAARTMVATVDRPLPTGETKPDVKPDTKVDTTPPTGDTKPVEVASQPRGFTPEPTYGVLQKPCSTVCFYTQYYRAGHYAVDMQERGGGPVYAAEAGTVIRSDYGWNGGFGNVIEVDHGNGLVTLYAHNKELYVKVGDNVARGQTLSWMGNTGLVYGKTGIHVHFEVRLNGVKKNPLLYLE